MFNIFPGRTHNPVVQSAPTHCELCVTARPLDDSRQHPQDSPLPNLTPATRHLFTVTFASTVGK